jgi:hypothetical protein
MNAQGFPNWSVSVSLVLLSFPIGGSIAGETTPAMLTAPQLRAKILQAQERIESIYVAYRATAEDRQALYPLGAHVYRQVAAKAPCYYFHLNTHFHNELAWKDDPLQQCCYVTADRYHIENRVNRTFSEGNLQPTDRVPGSLEGELFFLASGLWPLNARPAPRRDGQPCMLRDIAQSADYVVAPDQESVRGRWCHVLESPERDRLWLDVQRGCVLLKRETRSTVKGPLATRFELGGYREVKPGIWLPTWIRNTQFDFHARTPAGRHRKVIDVLIEIVEARVNDVRQEMFAYQPPPGSLRLSASSPPQQVVSGGLDHLDDLVLWCRRFAPARQVRHSLWKYGSGLTPLILIVLCEAWIWRRRQVAHRESPEI